jgi:hypothetical protein
VDLGENQTKSRVSWRKWDTRPVKYASFKLAT